MEKTLSSNMMAIMIISKKGQQTLSCSLDFLKNYSFIPAEHNFDTIFKVLNHLVMKLCQIIGLFISNLFLEIFAPFGGLASKSMDFSLF